MDRNDRNSNSRNHVAGMDRDSNFILRKLIIDVIILFCVGFLILVFFLWGTPYERGFFCDDESLKHPYKESTVTNLMLYIIGIGVPVFTMLLTEWIRLRDYKSGRPESIFGREVPAWIWEAYRVIGVFLFGCACQQLTTDVAKYSIGRLRPHFFDSLHTPLLEYGPSRTVYSVDKATLVKLVVCKPDVDCSLDAFKWKYIVDFKCLGNDPKLLKEMRLSFPSGHASFSAYTMFYFAMYLHKRFTWRGSKLLRHAIQFLLVMLSWYTVMTRVSDYKHHWSDVLAGFAIGLIFAVVVFSFVSDLRKTVRIKSPSRHEAELHMTNGNSRQAPV